MDFREKLRNQIKKLTSIEKHVHINLIDEGEFYEYENATPLFANDKTRHYFTISTTKDADFNKCISNKEEFENAVKSYNYMLGLVNDSQEDGYKESLSNMTYDEFFSTKYKLYISGEVEDIVEFLNKNNIDHDEIILSKQYNEEIYDDAFDISNDEEIKYLLQNLKKQDNLWLKTEGNSKYVSISDYKNTIDYIDNIVERTKKLNFSPIEQLMYAYDIVRDRYYISEGEYEDVSVSRDLTSVIKGDKIVCLGFAEIYDKVAKKLGFNSIIHFLYQEDSVRGHARNMIYVKDDKYDIDGIYLFDPTAGCKTDETNKHFDSYAAFAKTNDELSFMDKVRGHNYKNRSINTLNKAIKLIYNEKVNEITSTDAITLNSLSKSMLDKELFSSEETMSIRLKQKKYNETEPSPFFKHYENVISEKEISSRILKFNRLFEQIIEAEPFIEILTNVRKKQYYENSEKFPLSTDKIIGITKRSAKTQSAAQMKILKAIFGEDIGDQTPEKLLENKELDKEINGVRLAKTLRNVLEQKKENK